MVLHHVADGAGLLIEEAAALHAETLGHGDLHAFDVVAVPDRLQEGVGEAEEMQVLDRVLAEIMVDAKDRRLVEVAQQDAIESPRRIADPCRTAFRR